jgi:hypothetical protein
MSYNIVKKKAGLGTISSNPLITVLSNITIVEA